LPADIMVESLRAHPVTIVDGTLQANPCYLTVDQLLAKRHGGLVLQLRDRYLAALRMGAYREALDILLEEALWQDVPVPILYLDVIQPAQYEIGRLWQGHALGVADEHLAT